MKARGLLCLVQDKWQRVPSNYLCREQITVMQKRLPQLERGNPKLKELVDSFANWKASCSPCSPKWEYSDYRVNWFHRHLKQRAQHLHLKASAISLNIMYHVVFADCSSDREAETRRQVGLLEAKVLRYVPESHAVPRLWICNFCCEKFFF